MSACRCEPNPFQCGVGCTCVGCGCLKERPILFTGENVVRIFNGVKTQTRRLLKLPDGAEFDGFDGTLGSVLCSRPDQPTGSIVVPCPYGKKGDRLWVRETWAAGKGYDAQPRAKPPKPRAKVSDMRKGINVWYRADFSGPTYWGGDELVISKPSDMKGRGEWRPSIFMPRWASRLQLEVTRVRAERLHTISEADARAEGVENVEAYRRLWNEINRGDRRREWITTGENETVSSPWVWCIEFKPVEVTCG